MWTQLCDWQLDQDGGDGTRRENSNSPMARWGQTSGGTCVALAGSLFPGGAGFFFF